MEKGIVNIHGKQYITVGRRVYEFRLKFPNYKIITNIIFQDKEKVILRAEIRNENDITISTGFSEEIRSSSHINKSNAIENAETSAVGRALAFFHGDYMGTDYNIASAEEIQQAIKRQKQSPDDPHYICNSNQIMEFNKELKALNIVENTKIRYLKQFHNIEKDEKYEEILKIKYFHRDMKKIFPKGYNWIMKLLYILEGIEINTGLNDFTKKIKYLNNQGIEKLITELTIDELTEISKQEERKYQELADENI